VAAAAATIRVSASGDDETAASMTGSVSDALMWRS
jgi:hypothetical protein